jgi:hypothetical protein
MFLKLLGRRREPILAATDATETLRYATIGDRSTVACDLDKVPSQRHPCSLSHELPKILG